MSTVPATKAQTSIPAGQAGAPWPGLFPFTEELQDYFFGRDDETSELFRRVKRDVVTVLYSKSGLGKSSLLQAGLFPRLRKAGFLPVYIRLKYDEAAGALEWQVMMALQDAIQNAIEKEDLAEAASPGPDESLWEYLHCRSGNLFDRKRKIVSPVLVFDQFEEIFTRGESDEKARKLREEFLVCLGDLVESLRIPHQLSERLADDPKLAAEFTTQFYDSPTGYKFVFSLRDEYVSRLDELRNTPSLASSTKRMGLKQLNGEQALLAVSKPKPELLTTEVSELIVRFVAGEEEGKPREPLKDLEVAPPILSLFCQELNIKRGDQPQITADLVQGNAKNIIDDFYHRYVDDKPEAVQRLIEEKLVTESGYRDDIDVEEAKTSLEADGVPGSVIGELVESRLLHYEEYRGRRRVELTHDVLLEPAKRRRKQREEKDAREKEEADKARALEAQLAEEREAARVREVIQLQKLAEEQRQRAQEKAAAAKKMKWLAALLAVACAFSVFLAVLYARKRASAQLLYWQSHSRELAFEAGKQSNPQLRVLLALKAVYVTWKAENQKVSRELQSALQLALATQSQLPLSPNSAVAAVTISGDWKRVATINPDGSIDIEEAIYQHVRSFEPAAVYSEASTVTDAKGYYTSQAFSPVYRSKGLPPRTTATNPSCKLAEGSPPSSAVDLWSANNVRTKVTLLDAHAAPTSLRAFSRDGKYLAFTKAGAEKDVTLWNVDSGSRCEWIVLPGSASSVSAIAFASPDSGLLAIGNADGTAKLWNIHTQQELRALNGHQGGGTILAFTFSPDGKRLASSSSDRTVSLWDVGTGEERHVLKGYNNYVLPLAFSHDGKLVATGDTNSIKVWDADTGQLRKTFEVPASVQAVTFSKDGNWLAVASVNVAPEVRICNLKTGDVREPAVLKDRISLIGMNDAGNEFVTVTDNGSLNRYTVELTDEIKQATKDMRPFTDEECKKYVQNDPNCNDFSKDKDFSFSQKTERSPSVPAQAQR